MDKSNKYIELNRYKKISNNSENISVKHKKAIHLEFK